MPYGGIESEDLVAADLSQPWDAKSTTTTEGISLGVIRTLRSSCKIGDGKAGKPDISTTTETLFNIISGVLQVQQRFTENKDVANAGFTNVVFEGMTIAADDYVTAGYMFVLNSKYVGWAIHSQGYFARTPWGDLVPTGVAGKTLKIFWDGNLVVSNRKSHAVHTNLS